jgi:hypothetical protein
MTQVVDIEEAINGWEKSLEEAYAKGLTEFTACIVVFADWLEEGYNRPDYAAQAREFASLLPKWAKRKTQPKDTQMAIIAWSIFHPKRKNARNRMFAKRLIWPDHKAEYAEVVGTIMGAVQRVDIDVSLNKRVAV